MGKIGGHFIAPKYDEGDTSIGQSILKLPD